jgi:hypothetical protein
MSGLSRSDESIGDLAAMNSSSILLYLGWQMLAYAFLWSGEGGLAAITSMAALTSVEFAMERKGRGTE